MNWQRTSIGLIAIGLLIAGGLLYVANPENNTGYVGILIRVGVLLSVIWLSMPQLEPLKEKLSTFAVMISFCLLIIVAARPNWVRIGAAILVVTLIVNWVLKFASRIGSNRNEN